MARPRVFLDSELQVVQFEHPVKCRNAFGAQFESTSQCLMCAWIFGFLRWAELETGNWACRSPASLKGREQTT